MRTKIILFLLVIFTFNAYTQEALKILPLGNSITYDNNYEDVDNPRPNGERISYRYRLYQLLTDAGYTFDFIGSENGGGTYFPDTQNGGFPGISIEELNGILNNGVWGGSQITPGAYLNTYVPDIILLHIGTNNISANPSDVSTHISYLMIF
ncbi:MAG: hypothetical protein HC905_00560 [Bacteroidales bacterium]|nr:hypothetical protein [Bacteroidales bacterium]